MLRFLSREDRVDHKNSFMFCTSIILATIASILLYGLAGSQNVYATNHIVEDQASCEALFLDNGSNATWIDPDICSIDDFLTLSSSDTLAISPEVMLEVTLDGEIFLDTDSALDVNGIIYNYGVITNNGTFTNNANFTNAGVMENIDNLTNAGNFTIVHGSYVINYGNWTNDHIFNNTGTMYSYGILDNFDTFNNTGVFWNIGNVTNYDMLTNSGYIINIGLLDNSGIIDNTGYIGNAGTISNDALISNLGDIKYDCGSAITGNAVSGNDPVNICVHPTTLTLDPILSVPWGQNVTITGSVVNSDDLVGVSGATITFTGTGADFLGPVVAASDGTFTVTGTTPSTVATGWRVKAQFAGDSNHYADNSPARIYNTKKHIVSLELQSASKPWGRPTAFTATLKDITLGNALIEGKDLTIDGTYVIDGDTATTMTTNASGIATWTGIAPSCVCPGWTAQAHFAGDSLYAAKNSPVKTYSTIQHFVKLEVQSSSKPWEQTTTFTVTLKDIPAGNSAIEGMEITIDGTYVNGGDTAWSYTTDASGTATWTGVAPSTVDSGWTVQAHFAGDSLYAAKDSVIKTYSTAKHKTSLSFVIAPNSTNTDADYHIQGFLKDLTTGQPLESETITFTADSPISIGDATTNALGAYRVIHLISPSTDGNYSIQAHFAGNDSYLAKDSIIRELEVAL